jgi:rhodanese-related sulfurtransferase
MFHQKPSLLTEIASITADQLKEKIETNADLIMINVLSEETYVDCHITESINIPYERLIELVSSWDKDKEIVLYCAQNSCSKARQAYELLHDMGFTHLYQYEGGMKEWIKKGFDTTGICTMRYLHE